MSYQVLARKWRPKTFEQLMGQEHVVTVLVNALAQQRLHHAYLFTGTRGVGKTTIARIFAKSLNCQTGITATPCGVCDVCLDIDQGRFVDLLEIDAASRTKVDDTREILDNVQYAPSRGRYKVYLIDEVHMLSRSSFNALLKTLEEPPEHVKFILATTDPQKLPITVLSRCLQFHLKALTVKQIEEKLAEILLAENVTYEEGTLTLLAKAARGSMRDSLSLTDQAIAQGQGHIQLTNIQQMLGGIDQNWVYKILIALIKQDSQALMTLSQEIASYAPNYNRLFAELIQLLHQTAMYQVVKKHLDLPAEHAKLLEKFSRAMSAEDIQLYYQITLNGRKDLPYAADEQAAFDMVLLRLLAFKPMQAIDITTEQTPAEEHEAVCFAENVLSETAVTKAEATKAEATIAVARKESVEPAAVTQLEAAQQEIAPAPLDDNLADQQAYLEQQTESSAENLTAQILDIEQVAPSHQTATSVESNDLPGQNQTNFIDHNANEPEPVDDSAPVIVEQKNVSVEPAPVLTDNPQSQATNANITPSVDSVLATRNMLRSRKKQLEQKTKKSSDAAMRQKTNDNNSDLSQASGDAAEQSIPQANVPELASLPEKPFSPEIIDPAKVRLANQVDKWANMIDSMALNGRIRQLAIHATICENSTDDCLRLKLDQATKHLNNDTAHKQLERFISEYLQRPICVEINIVEKTVADPYQIQSHINDKRYDYAKALLLEDEIVVSFMENFQATIDEKTIVAR